VVRAALDGGVNWFDTAELYGRGRSERALTSALRALGIAPDTVVIATKWSRIPRTASSIVRSVDKRLEALHGYPMGLHQIHFPHGSLSPRRSQVRSGGRQARQGPRRGRTPAQA
jgi:aryl-alcohol dehydrogenase-like predicted oxidoreductase